MKIEYKGKLNRKCIKQNINITYFDLMGFQLPVVGSDLEGWIQVVEHDIQVVGIVVVLL